MSRYRKIEVKTWADKRFRGLSPIPPSGQGLWFFLLTGPHTGPIPGLFRAGRASMAEELGWEQEAFDKAFHEISVNGMAKADFKARLVWLPNALKHNKPESPNVVRSWRVELDLLPECALKAEAITGLREYLETIGAPYVAAFDEFAPSCDQRPKAKPFAKPPIKAMSNQEQEQEQEQKQDHRKTVCTEPQSDSPPAAADLVDLCDVAALDAVLADGTLTEPPSPAPTAPPAPVEVPVVMMPLAGTGEFAILQSHVDGWVDAYPGVDVIRQLAIMRQWCIANPRKRKTRRGVLAFCNTWLTKEQDRASTRLPVAGPARGQLFDPVAHVNQGGQPPLNGGAGAIIDINPR